MTHDDLKRRAERKGINGFGSAWQPDGWAVAPGRIELIGNHTDYNGGPVLAAAIDKVMCVASGPIAKGSAIGLVAADLRGPRREFRPTELGDWHATSSDRGPIVYVKGIVAELIAREIPFRTGVGLATAGDIPPGFGMSSSAALCLAVILSLTIDDLPTREMVDIARRAEHRSGAKVGAMDQSASAAGEVIRFDGRDNSFEHISPDLGDCIFAVADSGQSRSLRTSSYGKRVEETEQARKTIAEAYDLDLPNLAALTPHWSDVESTLDQHLNDTLIARTRHIITECQRVDEAEQALRASDWETFGRLMNESGQSSATDYEISHPVVEELVAFLQQQQGVLGARMMGGGEGGPALMLLRKDAEEAVRGALSAFYAKHPVKDESAAFQTSAFGPGAHRESID